MAPQDNEEPRGRDVLEDAFARPRARRGSLWEEEPARRRRLPDPVRRSAVRAGLIVAVTVIEVNVAVLGALAGTWLAAPATLAAVLSTILATWAVLDVWVTRQVHVQRHGVVSVPSSAARPPRVRREQERRTPAGQQAGASPRQPHLSGV
ncbi:hypothetical protein GCM10027168_72200 [Streptomyces capparidis]